MRKIICLLIFTILLNIFTVPVIATTEKIFVEYIPKYKYMGIFTDNLSVSYISSLMDNAIINKNNQSVYQFNSATVKYNDGIYTITTWDGVEVYNSVFKLCFALKGIDIGKYKGNKISVTDNNFTKKLYNLDGQLLLTESYANILYGDGDCILLDNGTTSYIYDLKKQSVIIDNINYYEMNGENHIVCRIGDCYGVVDFYGKIVIEFNYNKLLYEAGGYYRCVNNDIISIYNNNGVFKCNLQISKYATIGGISDNLVSVKNNNGIWSYIDFNENIIVSLEKIDNIKSVSPFYNGTAIITIAEYQTYIDVNGKQLTEQVWDKAYHFYNGYALVMLKKYSDISDDLYEQWYIINESFEIVKTLDYSLYIDFSYPASTNFSDGYIRTYDSKNNLMGYIMIDNIVIENSSVHTLSFLPNNGTGIMNPITNLTVGTIVTLPACTFTRSGYTFSHWTDGTNNYQAGDTYTMPDHDVTMSAVWKKDITPPIPPPDDKDKDKDKDNDDKNNNRNSTISFINIIIAHNQAIIVDDTTQPTETKYVCPYKDILGHWGEDIIKYISEYGLIDGITETAFKPDASMTREVFFIAMARLAGITENHIDWAKDNGILMGYGNGEYGLQDTITREQMAVIFKRYFDKMELDITDYKTVTKKQFADHDSISSWAVDSVYEMQEVGLVRGKNDNLFDPLGKTTRAEGATVLYNLIQTILEKAQ